MEKLKWYKYTEYTDFGQTELAVDKATVWEAAYNGKEGLFTLDVYPLKLFNKNAKGWEYRITETEPTGDFKEDGIEYDSAFEGSNYPAPTAKVAMKWAEAELENILEERRAKKVKA